MKRFALAALMVGLLASGTTQGQGKDKNPVVIMETSMGTIKIELYEKKAPVTVKNFLDYVDNKFYDGVIFHRVIPNFMIQGGGMEPGLKEKKTKAPIVNESTNGLSNERGTLAMARTNVPDSATAQFFITLGPTPHLDNRHSVFGEVVEGLDVVKKIGAVPTGRNDRPVNPVVMNSVRIERVG